MVKHFKTNTKLWLFESKGSRLLLLYTLYMLKLPGKVSTFFLLMICMEVMELLKPDNGKTLALLNRLV